MTCLLYLALLHHPLDVVSDVAHLPLDDLLLILLKLKSNSKCRSNLVSMCYDRPEGTDFIRLLVQVRDGLVEFVADLLEVLQLFRLLQTEVVVRLGQDVFVESLHSRCHSQITI